MSSNSISAAARRQQDAQRRHLAMLKAWAPTIGVVGFLIATANVLILACMCGHYSNANFPLAVLGAAMTWLAFFTYVDRGSTFRILLDFFVVVTTLFLARVIFDIAWGGHHAAYEYDIAQGTMIGHTLTAAGAVSLAVLTTISIVLAIRRKTIRE